MARQTRQTDKRTERHRQEDRGRQKRSQRPNMRKTDRPACPGCMCKLETHSRQDRTRQDRTTTADRRDQTGRQTDIGEFAFSICLARFVHLNCAPAWPGLAVQTLRMTSVATRASQWFGTHKKKQQRGNAETDRQTDKCAHTHTHNTDNNREQIRC